MLPKNRGHRMGHRTQDRVEGAHNCEAGNLVLISVLPVPAIRPKINHLVSLSLWLENEGIELKGTEISCMF